MQLSLLSLYKKVKHAQKTNTTHNRCSDRCSGGAAVVSGTENSKEFRPVGDEVRDTVAPPPNVGVRLVVAHEAVVRAEPVHDVLGALLSASCVPTLTLQCRHYAAQQNL